VKTMAAKILRRLGLETWSLVLFAQSGGLRLIPAPRILPVLGALDGYGLLGAATVITAVRDHNGVALIDERGALSYGDLDNRTNALASEWRRRGLGPGASVAILAANHRGFLEAVSERRAQRGVAVSFRRTAPI
jgi:fatty-acyl-CoA synthase